jgi:hypothetical protein
MPFFRHWSRRGHLVTIFQEKKNGRNPCAYWDCSRFLAFYSAKGTLGTTDGMK